MFTKDDIDYNEQMHGVNVKTIKQNKDDDGNVTFEADDFNDEFFKVQGTPTEGNYHLLMKLKNIKHGIGVEVNY